MNTTTRDMLLPICLVAGISACGINPVKSTLPLDLSNPGGISIDMATGNGNLDTGAIKKQVGSNLSGWGYPIAAPPISHTMTVDIGPVRHGSTPTGFSFNIGNSDPRALEFQKADVLPVNCKISSTQHSMQSAELFMGFSDSAVTGANPDVKALSDHVSTVCFNLLQEIKWPVKTSGDNPEPVNPSWMPEIRIETETESGALPIPPVPAESALPKPPSVQPDSKQAEPETVTKEITKEGRKVYIIHNQGNPVIFKFGYERK